MERSSSWGVDTKSCAACLTVRVRPEVVSLPGAS